MYETGQCMFYLGIDESAFHIGGDCGSRAIHFPLDVWMWVTSCILDRKLVWSKETPAVSTEKQFP